MTLKQEKDKENHSYKCIIVMLLKTEDKETNLKIIQSDKSIILKKHQQN